MADLDAALVQKIFNIAKRKRKPNIHHDGQTDDLEARLEVAKRAASCHPATLSARPARLKTSSSDSANNCFGLSQALSASPVLGYFRFGLRAVI